MENANAEKAVPAAQAPSEVPKSPERPGVLSRCRARLASLNTFERETGLFVLLPTLLVFVYSAFLATPMYISETKFAVNSGMEQTAGIDFVSQIFKTTSTTVQDARVVEAYIRSPDAFAAVDEKLGLIAHYSDSGNDIISRLNASPTLWDKESYWERVANPVVDPDTGIVTFTVRAYAPGMARDISAAILSESEKLVNEMNERARRDAVRLAETEVQVAKERIAKSQQAFEGFRAKHAEMDLQATATGLQSLVFELEGERAKVKTEIADAQSFMSPNAPALKNLQNRLAAVEKQLSQEKSRLVGSGEGEALSSWVAEYEALMIEQEFARKQLTSAMTALETARVSLLSQTRYIVPIEAPTLPDEARYPRAGLVTLCAFLGLFLIYGLVRLIVASIREHAGF